MPDNGQSLNPYSYVMNNPLKYTDPSGYTFGQSANECDADPTCNNSIGGRAPGTKFNAAGVDAGNAMSAIASNAVNGRLNSRLTDSLDRFFVSVMANGAKNYKDKSYNKSTSTGSLTIAGGSIDYVNDPSITAGLDWTGDRAMVYELAGQRGVDAYNEGMNTGFEHAMYFAPLPPIFKGAKYGYGAYRAYQLTKFKSLGPSLASVPGRVRSRINISNSGWAHLLKRHFSGKVNASQFSVTQNELKSMLRNKSIVGSAVTRTKESADGLRYLRELKFGRNIGFDKMNSNKATSIMTIMTDKAGNLVTAFPGILK